jgi:hypothetical protein
MFAVGQKNDVSWRVNMSIVEYKKDETIPFSLELSYQYLIRLSSLCCCLMNYTTVYSTGCSGMKQISTISEKSTIFS